MTPSKIAAILSKKATIRGITVILSLCMVLVIALPSAAFAIDEWSDIAYIEGRFSRVYFDYDASTGKFYCINDWVVNQDDGGVDGGLKPGEYNSFPFNVGTDGYEVRIYADGIGELLINDVAVDPESAGFAYSYSWSTSPNEPDIEHTIWEWSIVLPPQVIGSFIPKDPPGPSVPVFSPPPVPSIVITGPSLYPHIIDGNFADAETIPTLAPDPIRDPQDPLPDPWFPPLGFDIELLDSGGVRIMRPVEVVAASSAYSLWILGVAGLSVFVLAIEARRRMKVS